MSSLPPRTIGIVVALVLGCVVRRDDPEPEDTDTATSTGGVPKAPSDGAGTTTDEPDTTGVDEPKMDAPTEPPPQVAPCDEVGPSSVTVTSAETPLGTFPAMHAVFGWDYCCGPNPNVVLTVDPPAPDGLVSPQPDHIEIAVYVEVDGAAYEGSHEANVRATLAGDDAPVRLGQIEFLTPLSFALDPEQMDPDARLVARITATGDGWNLDVEVDAPHCSGYDAPGCPCE